MARGKTTGAAPRIRNFQLPDLEVGTIEDLLGGGYVEVLHFTGFDQSLLDFNRWAARRLLALRDEHRRAVHA